MTMPLPSRKATVFSTAAGLMALALVAVPLYTHAQMQTGTQSGAQPAPAAAKNVVLDSDGRPVEAVETDVSTRSVAVTSSFTGTEIIIFGSVEHSRQPTPESGYYDIAIVVDGTPTPVIARRKSNVAGIWINTSSVQFEKVPSYYAIVSTRPVEEITDVKTLDQHAIGFENVHMVVAPHQAQFAARRRQGVPPGGDTPEAERTALQEGRLRCRLHRPQSVSLDR